MSVNLDINSARVNVDGDNRTLEVEYQASVQGDDVEGSISYCWDFYGNGNFDECTDQPSITNRYSYDDFTTSHFKYFIPKIAVKQEDINLAFSNSLYLFALQGEVLGTTNNSNSTAILVDDPFLGKMLLWIVPKTQ